MIFKGISASSGIVMGKANVITKRISDITKIELTKFQIDKELNKLEDAVKKTKNEILTIKEKVIYDIGNNEANIFNAYLLLLDDPMFIGKAHNIIKEKKVNAEYALTEVLKDYEEFFNKISDSYLKERGRDITGLVEKLIKNLSEIPKKEGKKEKEKEKCIIVSRDLSPADTAEMDKNKILGFVTELGGKTSHTAIVARSLEIPAVVGVKDITQNVKDEDFLIIDGEKGIVVVNPTLKQVEIYKEEQRKFILKQKMLKRLKRLEAITLDKHKIDLQANIEFPEEVGVAKSNNADGIGLFRTEFIYINKTNLPTEEEQFNAYKNVVENMAPKPVTIRTLDIGGDKFLPYFKVPPEQNPFLGLRAIRLSIANINIFKLQLRAILRASAYGKVRLMFPMVTIEDEIDEAKSIVEEVKQELMTKEVPFDPNIEIGVMIEVPSAAIMSDSFAKKVDFFSIGTNDLIQYTLAVDRGNESVYSLYNALDPAVLRLIKLTIDNAHKNNIKVSVCGEMAGEPHLAFLLIGMGVDELSVNAAAVLNIKKLIRKIYFKDALETSNKILKMTRSKNIENFLKSKLNKIKGE